MRRFIAYFKQEGQGCDHTIGCGNCTHEFEAETLAHALKKLKKEIRENYVGESRLEYCKLFEIEHSHIIDVDEIYADLRKEEMEANDKIYQEHERREYERLKKKFENER